MTKEFEEKIKYVMGKVKFVKPGFLGLYMWWTESLVSQPAAQERLLLY